MSPEHRLPPGVPQGGPSVEDDPEAAEARGLAMLAATGERIAEAVEARAAAWVVGAVTRLADAWGRLEPATRGEAIEEAARAGAEARSRVSAALRELLRQDPAEQRSTPLEVVRSLRYEPTEVLRGLGIPPVRRAVFDERAFPDDDYDLVPRTLADLGDEELAPLHLAWGVAKATVLRARAAMRARGAR